MVGFVGNMNFSKNFQNTTRDACVGIALAHFNDMMFSLQPQKLFKAVGLLVGLILLFPSWGYGLFDEIVEEDLQERMLPMLGDDLLENRFFATKAFLDFPQWALPIIREAIENPQWEPIHWRLAYLLGVLGTQADIPLLLKATPPKAAGFQKKVWKGAAKRLFWNHRKNPSPNYTVISRLSFVPETLQNRLVAGQLFYKLVNPNNEGRLVAAHLDLWHVRPESPLPDSYYWIEAGDALEVQQPLAFSIRKGWETVRIDLKVKEAGGSQDAVHYKIEVPFTIPKN